MNIDITKNYIIPKNTPLITEQNAKLLIYAILYTNSLADENYDGLTNEAGLKLFITLDSEVISKETNLTTEQVLSAITELQNDKLIRVITQPHGKPPVIFIESLPNAGTVNLTVESKPEPEYTPAENDIFGCWEEVFGKQPDNETKIQLSTYLKLMDSSLLMLAIYDSENNESAVMPKLENYKQTGIKSVDDFKQEEPEPDDEDVIIYTPVKEQKKELLQKPIADPKQIIEPEPIAEPETQPPPATRKEALNAACDNTLKPTDINELWVSMQDVIDEEKWNDYTYLRNWLRERYIKMESIVKGGDRFVRMSKLQELIAES